MARCRVTLCAAAAFAAALLSCTDAGLYALDSGGPGRPDRAAFGGRACVPLTTGDVFPTKVLFAVPGGDGVSPDVTGLIIQALDSLATRFMGPQVRFSLVAYHSVATGLLGSFGDAAAFQGAIIRYGGYQEQGPVSLRAPLKLAKTILSGDMLSSCEGEVGRSRYFVVMLVTASDTSCANLDFNNGVDPLCLPPQTSTLQECSVCELTLTAGAITALAESRRAGEVTVQPIYVQTTTVDPVTDQQIRDQVAAIAAAGGTSPLVVTPDNLPSALNALNYASLQRELILKRLVAFNRNALVRAGEQLTDSDGDGLADVDEPAYNADPVNPDTDGDYLMDGIEVRMGMDPTTPDVVNGCNPTDDSDGDRLNDCEERVLGTNSCMGDTDSDTLPDLVEVLMGTNPLVPEDLLDADRDGYTNMQEIEAHTDPSSADVAFRAEHAYGYEISLLPDETTQDGRLCYDLRAANIGLTATLERPAIGVPAGTNDIYLYFQAGRENDPRGTGVSSLLVSPVRFFPPSRREPTGIIPVTPDDFVLGL